MSNTLTIIPLSVSQTNAGAALLTRAFFNDPFYTYIFPDPGRRTRVLTWLHKRTIVYALRYGVVHTTPALDGIALWLTPGNTDFTLPRALCTGLAFYPFLLSWSESRRSSRLMTLAETLHKRVVTQPHWYLSELAVKPERQGSGVGTALLQPVLRQAEREGTPCYLETNNEVNLPFYERNGFKVAGHDLLSPAGPQVWGMLWTPV